MIIVKVLSPINMEADSVLIPLTKRYMWEYSRPLVVNTNAQNKLLASWKTVITIFLRLNAGLLFLNPCFSIGVYSG